MFAMERLMQVVLGKFSNDGRATCILYRTCDLYNTN